MKAYWNNQLIADSNTTVVVEGNHYFPKDSINEEFFVPSHTKSVCPWKGEASYYSLTVAGHTNTDAAWYYPAPKEAANNIKGHIAFWKGVRVEA